MMFSEGIPAIDPDEKELPIRYYKGKHKVQKISKQSLQRTALYEFLEPNPFGRIGVKHIIPVRLCWRKRR